ncbi:YdcH family protein [Sandarakinorhabdus sp. DWP1-3-1]|uniref:YdcH family protein n=1 Tax=Sandarakinorhabdus sp. DWP1-3-1 TaxID=2804627 RepID=UPI003CE9D5DA
MSSADIYRLSVVHGKLDAAIGDEARRRVPDAARLSRMKKLRLAIKDRIAGYLNRTRRD